MEEILFDSEEFKNSESYSDFMKNNAGEGILKIQASTANQALPLEGVVIEVSKVLDGNKVNFFSGVTDSSGIIDDIHLPAAAAKEDINEAKDIVYTSYDLSAIYPKNNIKKEYEILIFDNIKVIQPVRIPITTLIEGGQN